MLQNTLIILNLFLLESLLSVDNAAVLAIMVKDLPANQKNKALRYGLFGAYLFRGICLFLAAFLIKISWLKAVGGAYLLYLVYTHFTAANDSIEEASETNDSAIFKFASKLGFNKLWATIVLVEIMDIAFSIDNVFAAVAICNNFVMVMLGVAIGMLAMRFVAGWFVKLIAKYPSLENSAFIVIAILGFKLIISSIFDCSTPFEAFKIIMASHYFDFAFSALMMLIFFVPLLFKPHKHQI